jgi:hypothetical protein
VGRSLGLRSRTRWVPGQHTQEFETCCLPRVAPGYSALSCCAAGKLGPRGPCSCPAEKEGSCSEDRKHPRMAALPAALVTLSDLFRGKGSSWTPGLEEPRLGARQEGPSGGRVEILRVGARASVRGGWEPWRSWATELSGPRPAGSHCLRCGAVSQAEWTCSRRPLWSESGMGR